MVDIYRKRENSYKKREDPTGEKAVNAINPGDIYTIRSALGDQTVVIIAEADGICPCLMLKDRLPEGPYLIDVEVLGMVADCRYTCFTQSHRLQRYLGHISASELKDLKVVLSEVLGVRL